MKSAKIKDNVESGNIPSIAPKNLQQIIALETSLHRFVMSHYMGLTYDGNRDLFKTLGYKNVLTYDNYRHMYKRGDVAKVVIEKIPKKCWSYPPIITDSKEINKSPFQTELEKVIKKIKLFSVLYRADKLMRLGRYSVLFLGFNGVNIRQLQTAVQPSKNLELMYIAPFSEKVAKIHSLDNDPGSERYGKPLIYEINFETDFNPDYITSPSSDGITRSVIGTNPKEGINSVLVHHSRIIHHVEDVLENEIEGSPAMESIYNRLDDIQKILGGSAEMFWRNAAPGKVASTKDNATLSSKAQKDLQKQFDEYEHHLRRWLTVEGVDIKSMETYMNSPRDFMEVQLNIIAIVTGIPKRILMGSERGELASSQDQDSFNNLIFERCNEVCSPNFINPFIDRLIEFQILPNPKNDEYMVVWTKQAAIGAKDKSEIALNRTKAMKEYVSAPGADILLPTNTFLRDIMGYDDLQIKEIEEERDAEDGLLLEDVEDVNVTKSIESNPSKMEE